MNLPVAARELRVAAHDRASYRGRVWMGAIGIFTTIWIAYGLLDFTGKISGSVGAQIFGMQAWAAYIFACCAMHLTCDSISHEKRDGTLGLLFLTQLKGRDVVLGKLCSGMARYFVGALACLPILGLPILLGGIELTQSLFLLVSILNCMLFSASAGLFASAVCVERNRAASLAMSIVVFQCAILPIVAYSMLRKGFDLDICMAIGVLSPFFAQTVGQGALLGFERYLFALSLGIVFLFSILFLAAAAWITPRSWQVKQRQSFLARLRNKVGAWSNQTIRARSPLGRQLLDRNAYEWLAARRKSTSRSFWEFFFALLALCAALIFNFIRHNEPYAVLMLVCIPAAFLVQINCKIRVGGHACARICEDRDCNALELILSTPMTINQMVAGEFRALLRHLLIPILVTIPILFLAWYLCLSGVVHIEGLLFASSEETRAALKSFAFICGVAFFLPLDSLALAWVAIWVSLSIKKTAQARANAMIWGLCGPFIAFSISMAILENTPFRSIIRRWNALDAVVIIASYKLAWDLLCIWYCRKRLKEEARATVSDPLVHTRDFPSPFAMFARLKRFRPRTQNS
jgi:hypothetical protein